MQSSWTMRRIALATLTVLASIALAWALFTVRDSLIIAFIGILFGLAIKGPVSFLERHGVPRSVAMVGVLLLVLAAVPVVVVLLLPGLVGAVAAVIQTAVQGYETLATSTRNLTIRLPFMSGPGIQLGALNTLIANLGDWATANAQRLIGSALGLGTTIVSLFINIITIVTIGFLWLFEENQIRGWLASIAPTTSRATLQDVWQAMESQLGGYIRGLLVLGILVGALCGVGYAVGGVSLAVALGILVGLLELIPIPGVGMALSVIVVGLAGLADSPMRALIAIIWTILIFQFANMVLFPRIMGRAVGISALGVIVALMVFVSLLGPVGALLAIPLAGIIQIVLNHLFGATRVAVPTASGVAGDPVTEDLAQARALLAANISLDAGQRAQALAHVDAALAALARGAPPGPAPVPAKEVALPASQSLAKER